MTRPFLFAPHNPIGVCAKPFHRTGRGERLLAIFLTIQSADSIHGRAMLAPTIEMRTNPVGATMGRPPVRATQPNRGMGKIFPLHKRRDMGAPTRRRQLAAVRTTQPRLPLRHFLTKMPPVSLRLGHARVLTPHRGVIHSPRAASLPHKGRHTVFYAFREEPYCIVKALNQSTIGCKNATVLVRPPLSGRGDRDSGGRVVVLLRRTTEMRSNPVGATASLAWCLRVRLLNSLISARLAV